MCEMNDLTTMTEGSVTTTYTYDDWGRTLSKTDGTYSATYTWLFGDKLKQYATDFPGEGDVAFNYDGLGKRRNKLNHVNGVYSDADWTWYRWDAGWNMIGEYAAGTDTGTEWDAGALTRWYQGKAAHADGDPDSTAYNYYLHDHLRSPRATYNQSKAAVARLDFSTYGSPLTTAGLGMDVGYTGHKWDGEMGTFYAPYRYYSPGQARWLSRDPLGMVDGPNGYGYVRMLPTMNVDILGLQTCDTEDDCCGDAGRYEAMCCQYKDDPAFYEKCKEKVDDFCDKLKHKIFCCQADRVHCQSCGNKDDVECDLDYLTCILS